MTQNLRKPETFSEATQRGAAAMQAEMERYEIIDRLRELGECWVVIYDQAIPYEWTDDLKLFTGTREQCETWRSERAFAAGQEAMWQDDSLADDDKEDPDRMFEHSDCGYEGDYP